MAILTPTGIANEPDQMRNWGRRAARNGKPRKCPCYDVGNAHSEWLAGFDEVQTLQKGNDDEENA